MDWKKTTALAICAGGVLYAATQMSKGKKKQADERSQKRANDNKKTAENVDVTLADSFPASDPPSWTTH